MCKADDLVVSAVGVVVCPYDPLITTTSLGFCGVIYAGLQMSSSVRKDMTLISKLEIMATAMDLKMS
jgi:hypothetical protein